MVEEKITVDIIKLLINNPTEQQLDDAKRSGPSETDVLLPISVLNQKYVTLPVPEREWQSSEDIQKLRGMKEKEPHPHDYKVFKWEYFPHNNKARVYVFNDLGENI